MKAKQYAWKVVNSCGNDYRSAVRSLTNGGVIYDIDKWAKPNNSTQCNQFLFAFKTRSQARAFRKIRDFLSEFSIFKCEIKNPTTKRKGVDSAGQVTIYDASSSQIAWPKGTLFVDAIKLIN